METSCGPLRGIDLAAYDPAGGPADPDFIHYNVTMKVGTNVAPSTIFRVEAGDRNYQEAMLAAGMLRKHKARCISKNR